MYIKFIRFDVVNNTIEATWFQDTADSQESVKCVNYSADQKAEFLAEVEGGAAYVAAMGW